MTRTEIKQLVSKVAIVRWLIEFLRIKGSEGKKFES